MRLNQAWTKGFNQLSKTDIAIAGGKGASLGEMTQAKLPVPTGFVVLAGAFKGFLAETDLGIEIDSILKKVNYKDINSVDKASSQIRDLILDAKFPEDIGREIKGEFKKLGVQFVAVRSSATAEDSSVASWAGELESYLNVDEAGLLEAVKKCWSSLFTPRAIFYRFEKSLHDKEVLVAVVVQAMVQSEISGITFTVHPVTEDRNQMVIEAGWGLGEAIVGGLITPDTYIVDKKAQQILDKNISKQAMMIIRQGSGTVQTAVAGEKQEEQKLTDKLIVDLAEICQKIEQHYNFPQDIEWALEKGTLYITQSRPITTLGGHSIIEGGQSKKIFTELIHVGFPLATAELTNYGETIEGVPWSSEKFRFKPYCVFERINNLIYLYYDPAGIAWKKEQAGKFSREILKKKVRETYAPIQDILLKERALSKEEFKGFIEKVKKCWTWLDCMWWMIEYCDEKNLEMEDLLRLRKETEYFAPGLAAVIRNSIKKIMPAAEECADILLVEEIIKGKAPSAKELKNRARGCAYTDGKLFKSIEEVEKRFNIKIQRETAVDSQKKVISGRVAYEGKAKGRARIINSRKELGDFLEGEILVASTTTPDFLSAMKKAAAIISEHGGVICHAAITSRELKKPCVVGVKGATQVLKNGDLVEVDAEKGIVKIIKDDKSDYRFFYESRGYDFILEDLIVKFYVSWPIFIIGYKNCVRDFIPSKTLEALHKEGSLFTEKKIKDGLAAIQKKISNLKKLHPGQTAITPELWRSVRKDIDELFRAYSLFDISYSEGAYKEGGNKRVAKLIEGSKNVIRDGLDWLFFKKDGFFQTFLDRVAKESGVPASEVRWYRENELADLIERKKRLKKQIVAKRKKAYIFDRDETGSIDFKQGTEASGIMRAFEKELGVKTSVLKGAVANGKGIKITGKAYIVHRDYSDHQKFVADMEKMEPGDILITTTTDPEFMPALKKAGAVVTDIGGFLSHAAISARELGIPCVVGTERATKVFKTGELLEVDTEKGEIRGLNKITESYSFHARNTDFPFIFSDIAFRPKNYGQLDYVVLQKGDEVTCYLSPKGQRQALEIGENLFKDAYAEQKLKKLRDLLFKLKSGSIVAKLEKIPAGKLLSQWTILERALDNFSNFYFFCEQPIQEALDKAIIDMYPSGEDLIRAIHGSASAVISGLDKKQKKLFGRSKEFGRLKFEIHNELSALFEFLIKFLNNLALHCGLSFDQASFLRADEIKDKLLGGTIPGKRNLDERIRGLVLFPQKGKSGEIFTGRKYSYWKNLLEPKGVKEIKGLVAFPGKVQGIVKIHLSAFGACEILPGTVLVSGMTNPQLVPLLKNAVAIVTDEGGLTCHAAIISRELKIPCIVGAKVATQVFKDGDLVEVDADKGVVKKIKK